MIARALIFAGSMFLLAAGAEPAAAQFGSTGYTSKRELTQIRQLAYFYGESTDEDTNVRVNRFDLDDDGKNEAIVRFENAQKCGASSCTTLVIKWIADDAVVVGAFSEGGVIPLKSKTNGWHDLEGHYYNYKWLGDGYVRICRPDGVCENG